MNGSARLRARPNARTVPALAAGEHHMVARGCDVRVIVPRKRERYGLLVCLHGAGESAAQHIDALREHAERAGTVLVVPQSRAHTWDIIVGAFGPDVAQIDEALADVFARLPVDPARVAIEGFSDGASYALTIGLSNGDLFRNIFAFSPGFVAAPAIVAAPNVLIAHGVWDRVLSVRCSRRIVTRLREGGIAVDYREFSGAHVVSTRGVQDAFALLA